VFWYTVTLLVGFGLGFLLAAVLAASTRGTIRDAAGADRPVVDWPPFSNTPAMSAAHLVPGGLDRSPAQAKAVASWFSVSEPR